MGEALYPFERGTYDDVYAEFRGDVPHVVALMKSAKGRVLYTTWAA